jgi:hypothetical protein
MLLLLLVRPQLLGADAQSALGRLIPAFAPRFAVPAAPELDGGTR